MSKVPVRAADTDLRIVAEHAIGETLNLHLAAALGRRALDQRVRSFQHRVPFGRGTAQAQRALLELGVGRPGREDCGDREGQD